MSMVLVLLGCTPPPMLQYDTQVPAQTLSVIDAPAVRDGRVRFREIFCMLLEQAPDPQGRSCATLLHRLSDESPAATAVQPLPVHDPRIALLFVPGLFSDCTRDLGMAFATSVERLGALGYAAQIVPVSGRSSPAYNAAIIAAAVRQISKRGRQVVLIAHSKGAVDSLEFLVAYPELATHVIAVASVAGAINGSPLGSALSDAYARLLLRVDFGLCPVGDDGAVSSLRRSVRLRWLREHRLPDHVHFYSLAAFTSPEEMYFPLRVSHAALAEIDPRNDGQLLYFDQVIPGATLLGYANADHWAVTVPLEETSPSAALLLDGYDPYPRDVLAEALILYLLEDLHIAGVAE